MNKQLDRLSFIVVMLLMTFSGLMLKAQCTIVLKGIIQDEHNDEELSFALVTIEELQLQTITDEKGNFEFKNLCKGKYHLFVDHINCDRQSLFFTIEKDTALIIKLEHHSELLNEIMVNDHNHQHTMSQSQYTLSGSELQRNRSTNIADIASKIPGVSAVKTGSNISKPMIHGLTNNRVVIVQDETILQSQQWGSDHAPEIDGANITKISIIKGSAPILYGTQAMGGVVKTEVKLNYSDPHLHGNVSSQYRSNGNAAQLLAQVGSKIKNWQWQSSVNCHMQADQRAPEYILGNTAMRNTSVDTRATYTKEKQVLNFNMKYFTLSSGIFSGAQTSSVSELQEAIQRSIPFNTPTSSTYSINAPKQEVAHLLLSANYARNLSDANYINIKYYFQQNNRQEFDLRRAGRTETPIVDLKLIDHTIDMKWEYTGSENQELISGLIYQFNKSDNIEGTGTLPLIPDYFAIKPAAYSLYRAKLSNVFSIENGYRLEYSRYDANTIINRTIVRRLNDYIGWAGNFGVIYAPNEQLTIKSDLSYISRPPLINELYSAGLHQGLASLEFGKDNLTNEHSIKGVVDIAYAKKGFGELALSIYAHRVADYIYLVPRSEPAVTIRGAFLTFDYQNTDALIRGVDLLYHTTIANNTNLRISGSLIRSRSQITKQELVFTPPPMANIGLSHVLLLGSKAGKELEFFAECDLVDRQRWVDDELDYLTAPDAYALWSGGVTYKGVVINKPVKITLQARNIANTSYRNYLNRFRYFADEVGRSIDIQINFNF